MQGAWCRGTQLSGAARGRAGATQAERLSAAAVAATEHMSREEAHGALAGGQPLRPPVRDAVLAYWRRKRSARGKPLLRRLQAPTSSSDTNPFNVFRRGSSPSGTLVCQPRVTCLASSRRPCPPSTPTPSTCSVAAPHLVEPWLASPGLHAGF